jgi:hypothetical protein
MKGYLLRGFFPLRGAFFEMNAICLPAAVF